MAYKCEPSPTSTTSVNQPSLNPSHSAVPYDDTASVTNSSYETETSRSQLSSSIRMQANGGEHLCSIPKLDTICFGQPNTELVQGCLEHLMDAGVAQRISEGVYDYAGLSASHCREVDMYPHTVKMFNLIGSYFEAALTSKHSSTPPAPYIWINTSRASLLEVSRLKCYPAISMVRRQVDGNRCNIGHLLVPLELKSSSDHNVTEQVLDQYRAISSIQINRRFTYSLSLRFPHLTLWRLDKSNLLYSRAIDMTKNLEEAIHIVGMLMSSSYEELGYHGHTWQAGAHPGGPLIRFQGTMPIPPPGPSPDNVSLTKDASTEDFAPELGTPAAPPADVFDLEVESSFKEPRGWLGRCTYVAKVRDTLSGKYYTLKVSWENLKITAEGEHYLAARKAGVVIGLAEIVGYQTLPLLSGPELGQFEDLGQSRLLFATLGDLLEKCTSIVHLIEAIRDAVICHRDLVQRAGLLHRDVSYNNVLLNNNVETHARIGKGLLIDLEFAKKIQREQANAPGQHGRTGTVAFMAAALLSHDTPAPAHQVHHDLESFFWVLLYTCSDSAAWTKVDGFHRSLTPTYWLNTIFLKSDAFDSFVLKACWMTEDRPIVLSSRFTPLVPHFSKLRDLFSHGHPRWPKLVPGIPLPTHEGFLHILDDALHDPVIQNSPTFRPEDIPVAVGVPTWASLLRFNVITKRDDDVQPNDTTNQKRKIDTAKLSSQEERPLNKRKGQSVDGNPEAS